MVPRSFAGILLLFFVAAQSLAQPAFPALTGRVVDAANLIGAEDRQVLEAKLKAHEARTGDQIVVATVPTVGELTIEDYANRLFRHWRLGEADRNNGVLLLVAQNERKVRIEVGYGLEGALTDALSKVIITTAVAPRFQRNDFAGGLSAGADAIIEILTGDAEVWQRRARVRSDEQSDLDPFIILLVLAVLIFNIVRFLRGNGPRRYHRTRNGRWIAGATPMSGGWSGGGSRSGGGFSGGGGSSGGGGASGSW